MFNWTEYDKVNEMVNDPHDELCNSDARAEYLFDVYDELHDTNYGDALEGDAVDWDSINRIDCLIIDRLVELGRKDDWTDGELAVRDFTCYQNMYGNHYKYETRGIESYLSKYRDKWRVTEYVLEDDRTSLLFSGCGDTAQHALDNMRLVLPIRGNFHVKFCLNGDKDNVAFDEPFDDGDEYERYIESLPYDFIDADDTTHWVDYGDE